MLNEVKEANLIYYDYHLELSVECNTWYRYEFHSGTKSNFVPRLHGSHCTVMIQSFMWALHLTSHVGALLPIDTHALSVPVNSATHLVPERSLVPPLIHDTGTECGQISYRYENRSELVPVWLVPIRHFVSVSCKHPLIWMSELTCPTCVQLQSSRPLYSFEDNGDYVYDVEWSPIHPAMFAAVDGTGRLDLWNLNNDTEVRRPSKLVNKNIKNKQKEKHAK